MKSTKPLLIVLSCTRNYGWVTRAFLEGNTRWADYVIIVDQMSTDGTREMCAEYGDKVIIVDDPDMNYKESTRAIMAFNKGREIAGDRDRIFFALDIDEVMPANWMQTADGQRILSSQSGDEFSLHWANLNPDNQTYFEDGVTDPWHVQYKVFHDEPSKVFEESGLQIHSPLLPYMNYDTPPYEVKDFLLLHFGDYYVEWDRMKQKFYQVQDIRQKRSSSLITLFRKYTVCSENVYLRSTRYVLSEWLYKDIDLYQLINMNDTPIFVQYIKEIIKQDGIKKYAILDIWDESFCMLLGIADPSKWYHKLWRFYINLTQPYKHHYLVKFLDKLLKAIV